MDIQLIKMELDKLDNIELDLKINLINQIREYIHSKSPFINEPVDFIKWVKSENVIANDYNPNSVATPEMELLKISIENDGYTQPIVTYKEEKQFTVVDGFHRNRVCKEYDVINKRVNGYLPVTIIRDSQSDRNNRIASTIRHNRARGKHKIESMSNIVLELKRRNWSNKKIGKQLGMDCDEVLRLTQITGLIDMFNDKEFSQSWDAIHLTEIIEEEIVEEEIKNE